MDDIEQLESAILALENQRAVLGDVVADTAIASLQEKLAALKQKTGSEQRKMVTVLFADLVGFTSMAEKMEPEDVREVLEACFARWQAAIQQYGGLVEKFIGDAVMAVFGLSSSQEDDAERAVRSGLQMLHELEALNRRFEAEYGLRLAVRVGIHTGLAVVSTLSDSQAGDFVAVGDTVNLASRLQAAAPANGILISHDAYRQVRGSFDVNPVAPLTVKGKEKPVQAYRVLQAKPRAFRMETRGVQGVDTRMVGRQSELRALQAELAQVVENQLCRVVTVFGEAGIGKSRLMREFEEWLELHPQHLFYFRGRAFPFTQVSPYSLLRDLFTFRFQIHDSDDSQTVRDKLEHGFRTIIEGDDTGQMKAHIIGYVLGFSFSSPYIGEPGDEARQYSERAALYLREYFQVLAARGPIVILLEDIHWADNSSLDALQQMASSLVSHPLLFVCAARPLLLERQPNWGKGVKNFTRLNLEPLTLSESHLLVDEILVKVKNLPEFLGELVVESADGNPFYIEELIKMLIEDGVIQTGDEQWVVRSERLEGVRLPPTIAGVLQSRFDSLTRDERRLLQRASVIGRTFWDRAVSYLNQPPGASGDQSGRYNQQDQAILAALRLREMIFQRLDSSFEGTSEYFFKHALLRDVTYDSLLKRQRWSYHALAARWLEGIARQSHRLEEYSALIASHYELANDPGSAAQWYWRAGEAAAAQYANTEAIHHLTRALELASTMDDVQRFNLLLTRERVHERLGNRKQQESDLTLLFAIAEKLDSDLMRADVWLRRGALAFFNGEYAEMESASRSALSYARQAGDAVREASSHLCLGRALIWESEPGLAIEELEKALTEARRLNLSLESECLINLAVVQTNLGRFEQALENARQALALCQSAEDISGMGLVNSQIGAIYSNRGEREMAHKYMLRALELNRLIGHRFRQGVILNNLGINAYETGQYSAAIRFQEQSLQVQSEIDDKAGLVFSQFSLGEIWRELGAYERAQTEYGAALELAQAMNDRMSESIILSAIALLHAQTGQTASAVEVGIKSLALAQETNAPVYIGQALIRLAAAFTAHNALSEAETAYRQAMDLYKGLELFGRVMEALGGLASIAMLRGDLAGARGYVNEIRTYLSAYDLNGTDEPAKLHLTCCRVLRLTGQTDAAREVLAEGYELLEKRASMIELDEMRSSYLGQVSENNELLKLWEQEYRQ